MGAITRREAVRDRERRHTGLFMNGDHEQDSQAARLNVKHIKYKHVLSGLSFATIVFASTLNYTSALFVCMLFQFSSLQVPKAAAM